MEYKYCKKCGTQNSVDDKICNHCNYNFGEDDKNDYVETNVEETKNGKFIESYFKILYIVAPIIIIIESVNEKIRYFIPFTLLIIIIISIFIAIKKNKDKE